MIAAISKITRFPRALRRTFFGSIFQREVRALGRRRMPYWVRSGYTLLLIGIVTIVFLSLWNPEYVAGAGQATVLEELAPYILRTVAVVQMVALALIAPVLTAGAISDEKRQRTLATLLATPLTSRDIILGKLGARTVQLGILALVPMPLLLALRVFGGVEAEAIFASTALSLALGMLGASLALMFSIWHRRTPSVVFFALCSTAVLAFLPWLGMMATELSTDPDPDNFFFKCIAPAAMVVVLAPEDVGSPTVADVRQYWLSSVGYLTLASIGVVLFSVFILRGVLKREAAGTASNTVFTRLVAPGVEAPKVEQEGPPRDARKIGDRPVLWRELRQNAIGGGKRTVMAFALGIAILLLLYATAGLDHPGITATMLFIAALGLTAQAALSTPAAITAERDAGSWSVLLTTPVRPWQIVLGKTLGSMRRLWLLPAIVGFHLAIVMAAGWFHPIGALHGALLIGALVFMLASTGVCLGLVCRRGVTASVLNMGYPLILFLAFPIIAQFYSEYSYYNYYNERSDWLSMVVMVSNPFVMLQEAAITATAEWERFSYFLRYEMLNSDDTVRPLRFTGMVLLCSGGMAAIGGLALAIAAAGFNRWNGRPS
ncbi:MAG: ABC transporter permease subunit [Phycisphaera sp.]|nr:MAG: ABC transporter permease subunit [Phycisphaera sp.]